MFDIHNIKISPKARIKTLQLPDKPSEELAYFCGLMAGDGHIAVRENKADYYLTCEGNPADEKELYHRVVVPLMKKLFNIIVTPRMFQHTYGVLVRSKVLVEYLTKILGLPKNRKYSQLRIPVWIKCDRKLVVNYIRGLADTDFCLSLKKRHKSVPYYPVISGVSESKSFIDEIAQELELLGFQVSKHYDHVYKDSRLKNGYYTYHRISIYGHTQLVNWMKIVGFYSPKHLNKLKLWQESNHNANRAKTIAALNTIKRVGAWRSPRYSEGWI